MTIDLKSKDWTAFQKTNPRLPAIRTREFTELLIQHYLMGDYSSLKTTKPGPEYSEWLGHEIRYARKQRVYVNMWYHDLAGRPFDNKAAQVHESFVAEPFWELATILLGQSERAWNDYVSFAAQNIGGQKNCFESFDKYQKPRESYDFRFTDYQAVDPGLVLETLETAQKPSASALFLAWQILSSNEKPQSPVTKKLIARAAREADLAAVSDEAWPELIGLATETFERLDDRPDPSKLAAFMLP